MHDVRMLRSKVKNTSGGTKFVGYVPPHGRRLASDEEVEIPGNLLDRIEARPGRERMMSALEADLEAGDVQLVLSNPLLEDLTTGAVKAIELDNNTLTVVEPVWEQSQSV